VATGLDFFHHKQAPMLPAMYLLAGGTSLKRYSDTRYTELLSHPVLVQRLLENFVGEDFSSKLEGKLLINSFCYSLFQEQQMRSA